MREPTIYAEALKTVDLTVGPQLALLIFTLFMLGVIAWVLRPKASQTYAALMQRVLDDEG